MGVDVDIEAEASRILYEAAKKTFANRKGRIGEVAVPFDDFSGLRAVNVGELPEGSFMCMGFDTAGTKVEIAERVNDHSTIAYDLFAMVCDDAVVRGAEPALVGTNLDIRSLGTDECYLPKIRELAKGYVKAAMEANVAIINGEIAQMGSLVGGYGEFPFHWGAACVWFARKEKLFTGNEIQVGDAVVMLREHGFRTNGLSLVRHIFEKKVGFEWHTQTYKDSTLGELVLTPSIIYSRFIVHLHGGFDTDGVSTIHGVSHITGGGVPEKLGRVLRPSSFGARLSNLFKPPEIMCYCQELGEVSDYDAYRAWNMGQGMAVITPEPEKIITEAKKFNIDAQVTGEIVREPGIALVSKGVEKTGKEITFA